MLSIKNIGKKLVIPLLILIIWQILSIEIDNNFILPGWEDILPIFLTPTAPLFGGPSLLFNTIVSLERVIFGFLLAAAVAIPLGLISGWSKEVYEYSGSIISLLKPVPPIAWLPLAIAWFSIGFTSIIFIIFLGALFPILLSTIDGVRNVRKSWLETAETLGATTYEKFMTVIIPGTAPSIWTGLRVAFGVAWMCVVAAEMLPGTSSGLGFLIMYVYNLGQIQVIVAGMVVIGIIGIASDMFFKFGQDKFFDWQGKE
jgi:NitT/TauT family transport system permease protein